MDLNTIKNKKILLFSPSFFNYEKMIADKMREMGAYVDMYDSRSVTSAFNRALLKIHPALFYFQSLSFYRVIIKKNQGKDYDFILIVNCDMIPKGILKQFRVEYPRAKLCLYLHDSIQNIPGVLSKFQFFDTLFSFDSTDCIQHPELKFRPLFFADQYRKSCKKDCNYKYDISFLGTIHSDRYKVIRNIQSLATQNNLRCYWFLYLQSSFIYYLYKLLKKEFRHVPKSTFSFQKMSAANIASIVDESRIILDIQHPKQTGLTMRTIEMIGMNKKLITTNTAIRDYDFYNPNNIAVIDRKQIDIDLDFLKTGYSPLPDDIYERYCLQNWILEVLG